MPPLDHDLKRAIEEIKERAPIEEIVRERIPELRRRGRLWEACCPFHEERTPSFKVDPSRGTWHCFGACQRGGDVLSFVQASQNLAFGDALELLAARTGVELPARRRTAEAADDPGFAALAAAEVYFRSELQSAEGRAARAYLAQRRLQPNTIDAFGLGWAPRSGAGLLAQARRSGIDPGAWEATGLLRKGEDGSLFSFFRGRLVIPIRDVKGRTVGFGARRITDDEGSGPKYVNTPETPYFHKGRLIYGLDRALPEVRRGGRLILVEGYTDVMSAHQAGIGTVCAVLGTATTEEHAALVRRSGARRVDLVFDGDRAGRQAAWKALHGLLPLEVELSVATLPGGADPADVLSQGGAQPFLAQVELARDWFEFVLEGLPARSGKELAAEVDLVLELLDRLPKPIQRDSHMRVLAERLAMPVETVREAWRALPERRRDPAGARAPRAEGRAGAGSPGHPPVPRGPSRKPLDPQVLSAYKAAVGAVLEDPGLVPRVRPWVERCPSPGLRAVLDAVVELFEDDDAVLDPSSVMSALGDHPVRDHVLDLVEFARSADCPPHQLLEQSLAFLERRERALEVRRLQARVAELSALGTGLAGAGGGAPDEGSTDETQRELESLLARLTRLARGASPTSPSTAP